MNMNRSGSELRNLLNRMCKAGKSVDSQRKLDDQLLHEGVDNQTIIFLRDILNGDKNNVPSNYQYLVNYVDSTFNLLDDNLNDNDLEFSLTKLPIDLKYLHQVIKSLEDKIESQNETIKNLVSINNKLLKDFEEINFKLKQTRENEVANIRKHLQLDMNEMKGLKLDIEDEQLDI
jgi:transcription initiation factor TFIID subunit TAF12